MPNDEINDDNELITTEGQGGQGGGVFQDPKRIRGDSQTVCQLLSLGVIPEDQIETLVRGAVMHGAKAIREGKAREWASIMRVLIGCAALKQQYENPRGPLVAVQNNVTTDSSLEQKRQIQVEKEQLQLDQMRGELVNVKTIMTICEKMGRCMGEVIEMVAKHSPDLAEDVRGKFENLEAEINHDLAEE